MERGLVIVSGLTPSDAAHILGRQTDWNAAAAQIGAELWIKDDLAAARPADADAVTLASRIVEAVVVHTARVLIASVLGADEGKQLWEAGQPRTAGWWTRRSGRCLLEICCRPT